MRTLSPGALRLADLVRPNSQVIVGHGTAEPATLLEALVAQRADFAGADVLLHASFSTIVQPEHADCLRLQALGAVGTGAQLAAAGVLDIIPAHLSDLPYLITDGELGVDVVLLSVSPPDAEGRFSFGVLHDYLWIATHHARVVIAEMNAQMPFTHGGPFLTAEDIDVLVPTDRPLPELRPSPIGDVERAIAAQVANYLDDGAVLQFGIGAIPDAVAASLGGFRVKRRSNGALTHFWCRRDDNGEIFRRRISSWETARFAMPSRRQDW